MENPFEKVEVKPEPDESIEELALRMAKREVIYNKYGSMVNEVLDQFIEAHRQGQWQKGSDCSRLYCCHIAWFAGPLEKYTDPYDTHHQLRRRLEVTLEMDGMCNPTGFKVSNYEAIIKTVHVGVSRMDLINGIKAVME